MEGYQKIIANDQEMFAKNVLSRREHVNGAMREVIVLETDTPLTSSQVEALQKDDSWELQDFDGTPYTKNNYTELAKIEYWLAQVDENVALLKEKEAQLQEKDTLLAQATEAKEALERTVAEKEEELKKERTRAEKSEAEVVSIREEIAELRGCVGAEVIDPIDEVKRG